VVYSNIVSAVKILYEASKRYGYEVRDEAKAERVHQVEETKQITEAIWKDLIDTWRDPALAKAWKRASELQLADSAKYFFNEVERIASAGTAYVPTVEDIVHARQMTTGIMEIGWEWEGYTFRMIDVGGQRTHRRKWLHAFEGVTIIVYCVALSEYDQLLREDEVTNRMHESLSLFESLVNSEWFYKTPFLIFFNKNDLFAEKIKEVDLNVCWPEYSGGTNYDNALKFIRDKFLSKDQKRAANRQLYDHITTATSTENIKQVFEVSKHIFIAKGLGSAFGEA